MHPGQKMKPGTRARFGTPPHVLVAEVVRQHTFGRRIIRLRREGGGDVDDAIDAIGHIPLPPYIKRPDAALDRERYQTIYARQRGSVAAPTAGLHFTPSILEALAGNGIERTSITLHVGYGTFKPIRTDDVLTHTIDAERYRDHVGRRGADRAGACGRAPHRGSGHDDDTNARSGGGKIGRPIVAGKRRRRSVHIARPPLSRRQRAADEFPPAAIVVARSGQRLRRSRAGADAYRAAVTDGYRFYSYGDAMLVL